MAVLVVDDDSDTVDMLKLLFELEGIVTISCTDAHDAFRAAEQAQPDVCIIDIGMPGVDGLELARQMLGSAKLKHRPVMIAHTGHHRYEVAAFDSGYDVYLLKASTAVEKLVELVKAHIFRRERNATMAAIETDLRGSIIAWDAGAEKLYGWKAAEVLGKNILSVTPAPVVEEQAGAIMSKLAQGDSWFGKFAVQRRDGRQMLVFVIDRPLRNAMGELVGVAGNSFSLEA